MSDIKSVIKTVKSTNGHSLPCHLETSEGSEMLYTGRLLERMPFPKYPFKEKENSSFYQQTEENLLPNYKTFSAFAC